MNQIQLPNGTVVDTTILIWSCYAYDGERNRNHNMWGSGLVVYAQVATGEVSASKDHFRHSRWVGVWIRPKLGNSTIAGRYQRGV